VGTRKWLRLWFSCSHARSLLKGKRAVAECSEDYRMAVWPGIVAGLTAGFGGCSIVRWFLQGSRGWLLLGAYLLILALVMFIGWRGRYKHGTIKTY
jgi:hypothetical protein